SCSITGKSSPPVRPARGRAILPCSNAIWARRPYDGPRLLPMILRVEGLDLYYGDAQALDGVSIDAEEGDLIAIVGANGAGTSSLIHTIAGMEAPIRGRSID